MVITTPDRDETRSVAIPRPRERQGGTQLFKEIDLGPGNGMPGWPDPAELVVANDLLVFRAYHPLYGSELWVTDGTPGGSQSPFTR